MMDTSKRTVRWMATAAATLTLAACGGGGGDGGSPVPPPADARNGSYTMVAANTEVYTLKLDFDAETYSVAGTDVNRTGTFVVEGDAFAFTPGNGTGARGTNTLRFEYVDGAVVGGFALDGAVTPFVAARDFAQTVAEAAGTYNMLGRVLDSAGPPNTTIQQGEITAGGQLRLCSDFSIYAISTCPAASVTQGTITIDGDLFTATTPTGRVPFRVAKIGGDNVFLRASVSAGTTRRFMVGLPASETYARGTFTGSATDGTWGTSTVSSSSYATGGVRPDGTTVRGTGNASPVGLRDSTVPNNLVVVTDTNPDIGNLFSIRSSRIGVLVASRNNAQIPGWMAIGAR